MVIGDGDMFKTVNKYYGNKNRQWDVKEVTISVFSEGTGGKMQTIGGSKLNLSKFIASYFNSPVGEPAQTMFMEKVNFGPKSLVGDLEI